MLAVMAVVSQSNGSANVEKRGMPILQRISWYHTMIDGNVAIYDHYLFYAGINFIFATIYYGIDRTLRWNLQVLTVNG
jgi:hypothetical protein